METTFMLNISDFGRKTDFSRTKLGPNCRRVFKREFSSYDYDASRVREGGKREERSKIIFCSAAAASFEFTRKAMDLSRLLAAAAAASISHSCLACQLRSPKQDDEQTTPIADRYRATTQSRRESRESPTCGQSSRVHVGTLCITAFSGR